MVVDSEGEIRPRVGGAGTAAAGAAADGRAVGGRDDRPHLVVLSDRKIQGAAAFGAFQALSSANFNEVM